MSATAVSRRERAGRVGGIGGESGGEWGVAYLKVDRGVELKAEFR